MTQAELTFPEPALKSIVNRYRWATKASSGLDLDDLSQVAREAVEHSKLGFDPDRGKSFVGFAWRCARQAVCKHANEHLSAVRVPHSTLANRTGERRTWTNSITSPVVSGNVWAVNEDDTLHLAGVWTEPVDLDARRTVERVRACIAAVAEHNPYHAWVLVGICLDGRTRESLAQERGVSRQAIENIRIRALRDFERAWTDAGWETP